LFYVLEYLSSVDGSWLTGYSAVSIGLLVLIIVAIFATRLFFSVSPRVLIVWGSVLGLGIILGKMWPTDERQWRIDYLDVGHGNSAVIQHLGRAIIVDTGNIFGQDSTLAQTVVKPFLDHQKITDVDYIFITHQDKDHSAGLSFLAKTYPKAIIVTNNIKQCMDMFYRWGGLNIKTTMTKGLVKKSERSENNTSCLIHVKNDYGSAIFTGDIERAAEKKLIVQLGNTWQSQVMQIPHHGSKTSSSKDFVRLINPKVAVVSARAFNQWNFPAPLILKRYGNIQAQVLNTASSGQITVEFSSHGRIITSYRGARVPFWYNRDLSFGHYKR